MTHVDAPGRPRPARLAVALTLLLALSGGGVAHAQGGQPAKKDSSPRMMPKDVTLTARIAPATARPGETVALQVTAKLRPGWHIYTYAKEQQGEGPRNTQFDVYETSGLKVAGDWSASKAPERKKEPAFPDIEAVEYFEEQVVWTLPLKVPDDAQPGPRSVKVQASYQICDAKSCSFPGRWTLPDATVEVAGADQAAATPEAPAPAVAKAETPATATAPDAAPKKKDSPPRLQPKSVAFTTAVEPATAKPGDKVRFRVTAKLNEGMHIYGVVKEQPAGEGPTYTTLDLYETAGLKAAGDWSADRAPTIKEEPAFNNAVVEFFEGSVTWSIPLEVPADATPGERTLKVQAGYQVCDATSCSMAGRWTLPPAVLTIASAADVPKAPDAAAVAAKPADPSAAEAPKAETPVAAATPVAPAAAPAEAPKRAVSEVERKAQEGILPLIITSALGGLLALVMPCVWPMVPITVNFFLKQGQRKDGTGGSTTALAVAYCLAIIGVFTAVGVLCSFFLSATALPKLANNPWLNLSVAGLFFLFGLSLLGLFEIRLPNFLLNASSQGESRGGLVGVMFMALTLTITSFTCTFPVVGGLLVMASTGQFFYPIIGLGTFATVLALPFFLLALSPGLLSKMPRSGDWMNTVKVIGGLVEIGAAFKFLNTAELAWVTPENAWFDAEFVLTAWVALSAVCGLYLLGIFRTDHDLDDPKVGPGRLVLGTGFLGLALYLAPALFGRPPQSLVYDRLVIGLLPPDAASLAAPTMIAGGGGAGGGPVEHEKRAQSNDPKVAEREEARFHGVWWGFSYEQALERAKAENKPVLIDFTGLNCANCRLMEQRTLSKPEVVSLLDQFVTVQLYTPPAVPINAISADERSALAEANALRQIDLTNDNTNPLYAVLAPDGRLIGTVGGFNEPPAFAAFLSQMLDKFKGGANVANR